MSLDLPRLFEHRPECRFGSGAYRVMLRNGSPRYCQTEEEVAWVLHLLPERVVARVQRDGYCLDNLPSGDANTPDVVDAEQWLSLSREDAMRELGLVSEADYARAYRMIEDAVQVRDNRASQGGVRATIVIKKKGVQVTDVG